MHDVKRTFMGNFQTVKHVRSVMVQVRFQKKNHDCRGVGVLENGEKNSYQVPAGISNGNDTHITWERLYQLDKSRVCT